MREEERNTQKSPKTIQIYKNILKEIQELKKDISIEFITSLKIHQQGKRAQRRRENDVNL